MRGRISVRWCSAESRVEHNESLSPGQQICEILRMSKYLRNPRTGEIKGYGKKLLP